MRAVDFGCSPGNQGLSGDATRTPLAITDGFYTVPTAPGLGIEVDLAGVTG
jgi:L-alanine-DL-glutamate epimerase-like enolase superfamily enzyme